MFTFVPIPAHFAKFLSFTSVEDLYNCSACLCRGGNPKTTDRDVQVSVRDLALIKQP